MDFFKKTAHIAVFIFAFIGLIFTVVFIGMQFGLFNVRGSMLERNSFFHTSQHAAAFEGVCALNAQIACAWNATPEWAVIHDGLIKDASVIARVSDETGVSRRMIATVVVPEQVRFFTSDREIFKSYFEPLKILGSLSQFSLGVSGIKQETANAIEQNASDPTSPLYPGSNVQSLFAYPTDANHDTELYNRLTDPKDHYYSYLYTALYIKEVEAQWKAAGYDISQNPEAVATLFNIGFQKSHPNATPAAGGAPIDIGGATYTFGTLGALFYRSNELVEVFPK